MTDDVAAEPTTEAPTREEWAANGLAALEHLEDSYYQGRDGPGGLKVSTVRAAVDAIRTALEALAIEQEAAAGTARREAALLNVPIVQAELHRVVCGGVKHRFGGMCLVWAPNMTRGLVAALSETKP
jgi:hypothetical protein